MEEQQKVENRNPIETGCPDAFQYMHPLMRKNYAYVVIINDETKAS